VNKKVSKTVISKIVNSGMQARELYEAQKQASLLSKPILLLYAFERLALMLILTQNPRYESKEMHGVEFDEDS
jgi:hypothetical protein